MTSRKLVSGLSSTPPPKPLQLNLSGLLLSGHGNPLPVLAVGCILRRFHLWALKSEGRVLAMASQATARTVSLYRRILGGVLVTSAALSAKFDQIKGPMARLAERNVVIGINAVHAPYLFIEAKVARKSLGVKCRLNPVRSAAPDATAADEFPRLVMDSRVFRGHSRHKPIVPSSFTERAAITALQTCQGRTESMAAISNYLAARTARNRQHDREGFVMDGWTLGFSPGGGFPCVVCEFPVEAGYAIGKHPSGQGWECLSCMLSDVRTHIRRQAVS